MISHYPKPKNLNSMSNELYDFLGSKFNEKEYHDSLERIAEQIVLKEIQNLNVYHIDIKFLNEIMISASCLFSHVFPTTEIKKSKIEGNGLFSCENILQGSIISFYPVDYIIDISDNDNTGLVRTSTYFRQHVPENGIKARISKSILKHYSIHIPRMDDLVERGFHIIGSHPYLQKSFQNAHFINHSQKPNSYFYPIQNGMWVVISYYEIKSGEEITVNYGKKWHDKYAN